MKGLITVLAVLVVVGLAFFLYRTPSAPPEMTEAEKAQIQAEVEAAGQENRDAMMAGDVEGVLSHLTSDAVYLGPGYRFAGTEIRNYMEGLFTGEASITSWESQPIDTWIYGDAVYSIVRDDITLTQGEMAMTVSNHTFTRWVKEDGQWKLSYVFSSPVDAPPEG